MEASQDTTRWGIISATALTVSTGILTHTGITDTTFEVPVEQLEDPNLAVGYVTGVGGAFINLLFSFITVWVEIVAAAGWAAPLVAIPVIAMWAAMVIWVADIISILPFIG